MTSLATSTFCCLSKAHPYRSCGDGLLFKKKNTHTHNQCQLHPQNPVVTKNFHMQNLVVTDMPLQSILNAPEEL